MMLTPQLDWSRLFIPDTPLLEIVLRGSIVYLGIFMLLRLVLKRQAGIVGIADLLVVVLIADAAQNAMGADYRSITDGLILVATIVFWSYALDWLGYRFPAFEHFVHPPPLRLIERGRLLHHNMAKELLTEEELRSQLRQQGIEDPRKVKEASMEGDGRISVVADKDQNHAPSRRGV
ncbi:DUF421 domain-containing protein [Candidatus Nitrospira bockiana]